MPTVWKISSGKKTIGIQYFMCSDCGEFIVEIDDEAHEAFKHLSADKISEIQTEIKGLNNSEILTIGLLCGEIKTESKNRSQYNVVGLFTN